MVEEILINQCVTSSFLNLLTPILAKFLNRKSMMGIGVWGDITVGCALSWGILITRDVQISTFSATFETRSVSLGAKSISTLTGSDASS